MQEGHGGTGGREEKGGGRDQVRELGNIPPVRVDTPREYGHAQGRALKYCQARPVHDRICGEPISQSELYFRFHRDKLSGRLAKMSLDRARQASMNARTTLQHNMECVELDYDSYDDAIADLRKYIPVLEEQIKVEDAYWICFGNANAGELLLSLFLPWSLRVLIGILMSYRGHTTRGQPEGQCESRTEASRRPPRGEGTDRFIKFARVCLGTSNIECIWGL